MAKLDGKVAIITGSGRGIGRAYARLFAREGAAVTVVCRTQEEGAAVVDDIVSTGGKAIYVQCDVSDKAQVDTVVAKTVEAFGKINILVNNAQYDGPPGVLIEDIQEEVATAIWRSGVLGTLFFMQACFPYLKETKGNIVNTGSGAATGGVVGQGAYASCKEGIRGLTYVATNEWGQYGITINIIMPSARSKMYDDWARTNPEEAKGYVARSALRKLGDAEKDLAPVVAFLASDDSKYLTGQTIHSDGGNFFAR